MKSFFAIILSSAFIGCAQGNCRSQPQAAEAKKTPVQQTAPESLNVTDRVRVFKYDGSLQCGQGKPVSPEEMQESLKGVRVYSAKKAQDGLMHIQRCGSQTGKANVYEIDKTDLPEAKKRGFKEWTWD